MQADRGEAEADAGADELEEQLPVADLADDAARYAFAGECGITQQPSRPPERYLDETLVGELPHLDRCLLGRWGEAFGDDVVSGATIDRLVPLTRLRLGGGEAVDDGRYSVEIAAEVPIADAEFVTPSE